MIKYFIITLFATLIGSVAGMGGGVIIKPVLDLFGDYNILSISMLSSITVFSMALVATTKQIINGFRVTLPMITVTIGAVIGGAAGSVVFTAVKAYAPANLVTIIQSIILLILMVFCMVYDKLPTMHGLKRAHQVLAGIALGMLGTFLGIGGGPINVAVLVLIFGIGIREAARISVFVILFAQLFGLITKMLYGQFQMVSDYSMLLVMIPAAVIGSLIGSGLNINLKERRIHMIFIITVLMVIFICGYNIYTNLPMASL